jgi:hypothetical protein
MIERVNRTVNDMLSKYIKRHQKDWDDHLDFIIMAYNATPHESTGLTPHRLVYGREMTFPLYMITDPIEIEKDERKLTSEYVRILENNLKEGHEIARKNVNAAAKRQKLYFFKISPCTVTGGEFLDHFILNVISLSFSTMTHGPVQCRTILDLRPGAFLF